MEEYVANTTEEIWMLGYNPPKKLLEHFNSCEGCCTCDQMMEVFGECCCCDTIIDKVELYYDHPTGDWYCEDCVSAMPGNNTPDYVICGSCEDRLLRETLTKYHNNFSAIWICDKGVSDATYSSCLMFCVPYRFALVFADHRRDSGTFGESRFNGA